MNNIYRHELKYRINGGTFSILRQRLSAIMCADEHSTKGQYRVTSLYFDDIYRTAYRDKILGALHRRKFRIRAYDLGTNIINLEEKIKDGNVGYKKSVPVTMDEYRLLLAGSPEFLSGEKFRGTAGEDMYASHMKARMSPAVLIDYIREPYVCEAGNVRITFDMKVSVCINSLDIFGSDNVYSNVMPDNDIIMEVKYDSFIPQYILQMLTGIPTTEEAFSKYILCCDTLRLRY